jgi:hypothetical protein
MRRHPAKTTLADLQNHNGGWIWAYCNTGCGHRVALAIASFVIRWGADASSDLLRDRVRCSSCGRLGADLKTPSWIGSHVDMHSPSIEKT